MRVHFNRYIKISIYSPFSGRVVLAEGVQMSDKHGQARWMQKSEVERLKRIPSVNPSLGTFLHESGFQIHPLEEDSWTVCHPIEISWP